MNPAVFIGDETSAAGWRLAGVAVCTPAAGEETGALERASASAPLVLVAAAVAARIAPGVLRRALAAPSPLMLVLPDLIGHTELPDLAARLRTQLGIEA